MEGNEVQIAVLGADSNVAVQAREIAKLAEAMNRLGVSRAEPIRTLADAIPLGDLPATVPGAGVPQPVVGVRDDSLQPLGVAARGALLVAGSAGSGRSTALATLATALRRADPTIRLVHISPRRTTLTPLPLWSLSLSDPAQITAFADDMTAQLDAETLKPTQFAVFVENVGELNGSPAEADVDRIVKRALRDEVFVVGESESSTWSAAWTLAGPFKNSKRGLLLVPGDLDGDSLLGTTLGRFKRADLPPGRGFYVHGGRVVKLQVALPEN